MKTWKWCVIVSQVQCIIKAGRSTWQWKGTVVSVALCPLGAGDVIHIVISHIRTDQPTLYHKDCLWISHLLLPDLAHWLMVSRRISNQPVLINNYLNCLPCCLCSTFAINLCSHPCVYVFVCCIHRSDQRPRQFLPDIRLVL